MTVIDGLTNETSTVEVGTDPFAVAVNPTTNKIYSANGGVTTIDGATNDTTTVAAGSGPCALAVNPNTNKIYVTDCILNGLAGNGNTVTVIDGATNKTTSFTVGFGPGPVAVDLATNQIYIVNRDSNDVTVVDGQAFTLAANPGRATIAAGKSAIFTLTATPQGSFVSPISFSCEGLPAGAGCSFSPATLTPNFSTVPATLTITTAPQRAFLTPSAFARRFRPLFAVWLLLSTMLLGRVWRTGSESRTRVSFCLAGMVLICLQTACGGGLAVLRRARRLAPTPSWLPAWQARSSPRLR